MLHHSTRQNAVHSYLCCLPTGVQWNSQDLTTVRVRVVNTALQGLCGAGIPKNISDGWHSPQVPGALRNPWTKRARAFSTSATNDIYHNWSNRMCSRCLLAGAYVSVRSFSYRSYLNRPAELFTIARCLLIQVLLTLCIQPAPLCPQNTARGHD
jgi:hypothetical protein